MTYQTSPTQPHPIRGQRQTGKSIEFRDIFQLIWAMRNWIALSLAICLSSAFAYISTKAPIYQRNARILIATNAGSNNETALLSDLTGLQQNSNIGNEVFIMRSSHLMTEVVKNLELNVKYYNTSPLYRKYEYYKNCPIAFDIVLNPLFPNKSLPKSLVFDIVAGDMNSFKFKKPTTEFEIRNDHTDNHHYGDTLAFQGYSVIISRCIAYQMEKGDEFRISWTAPEVCGAAYSERLEAYMETNALKGPAGRTDVITLSIKDQKAERAEDILNTLIIEYNRDALRYKNLSVVNSIKFIDNRLEVIAKELQTVESNYRYYQSSNSLVNIQTQSQIALNADREYEKQLSEIRLQNQILSMIKDEMKNNTEEYKVIPSNIGLTDVNLSTVINTFNILVSERNRLIANSSEQNPRVRNLNHQLADSHNSIILSIDNLEKVYAIKEGEIISALNKSKSRISDIPSRQFDLTQIERKQQIIEPLYLLLQQKKEEAQISMYSATESARIIDEAYGSNVPVSPKRSKIFLLALFAGFLVPPLFIYLKNVFRTTVLGKDDIKKVLDIPILATIPRTSELIGDWESNSRSLKNESFRMLRSNLQFLSGKVIQVTSSTEGEGKTFIAANLAISIAHTGKKVILLGLDLRKPSLNKYFGDLKEDKANSIVAYLIGKCNDPAKTLLQWDTQSNLSVAFAGSVPPNPAELLDSEKLGPFIEWMKEHADYVIIDSAPIFPISDSIFINRYADNTLYVVRSGYTALKIIPEIKNLFEQSEIKSPKFILNCLDLKSGNIKYGYGYGYGYAYGYGKESGTRS